MPANAAGSRFVRPLSHPHQLPKRCGKVNFTLDGVGSVAPGTMFLVASLLCRYGAQLSAGQKEGERER